MNLQPVRNQISACFRMSKSQERRDKEERTREPCRDKFNSFFFSRRSGKFSAIKEKLTSVGIFSPKYLTIKDKSCGGKRRVPVLKRLDQNPLYVRRRNSDPVLKLTGDDECMGQRNSGRCNSDPVCVRQRNSDPVTSDTDPVLSDTEADFSDASTASPSPTSDEDVEKISIPGRLRHSYL
jgi:hypothetical protein